MKKFLFLLLAVTAGTAPAQTLVYPGEHEMPPVPKTFDNELGVRYGAQLYVGDGRGPELQAFRSTMPVIIFTISVFERG